VKVETIRFLNPYYYY